MVDEMWPNEVFVNVATNVDEEEVDKAHVEEVLEERITETQESELNI